MELQKKSITETMAVGKHNCRLIFHIVRVVGFSNLGWVSMKKVDDMGVVQLLIGDAW